MRNPVDRLTRSLPQPLRIAVDWILTLAVAVAVVLTVKVEVANPYRIPSSSMEPTLRCARPAAGCEGTFSDRVIANRLAFRFRDPHRGEIVVFEAPPTAKQRCTEGGTFVKRLIGLPGGVVRSAPGRARHVRHVARRSSGVRPRRSARFHGRGVRAGQGWGQTPAVARADRVGTEECGVADAITGPGGHVVGTARRTDGVR